MSWIESAETHYSGDDEQMLLAVAAESIEFGLAHGMPKTVDVSQYAPLLREVRASFVTLRIDGDLRGCMGAIKAVEPLISDVSRNAFAAAFRDPRFAQLTADEAARLEYHISILSEPTPIMFRSEHELLEQIRVGIDGLILYEGSRRGTLLPAVWRHVSDPREFLRHLKKKADLPTDYWSSTVCVDRYTAYSIGRE